MGGRETPHEPQFIASIGVYDLPHVRLSCTNTHLNRTFLYRGGK